MESLTVLKFSSEDCGTCHRMSNYDARVAEELGLQFVSVLLQDTHTYRRYRKVLLAQYPNKEGMGWPTYLVVSNPESDFVPKEISASGSAPPSPRPTPRVQGFEAWRLNPSGWLLCQAHPSRHMVSRSLRVRHPSLRSASDGSATERAASPARRGTTP